MCFTTITEVYLMVWLIICMYFVISMCMIIAQIHKFKILHTLVVLSFLMIGGCGDLYPTSSENEKWNGPEFDSLMWEAYKVIETDFAIDTINDTFFSQIYDSKNNHLEFSLLVLRPDSFFTYTYKCYTQPFLNFKEMEVYDAFVYKGTLKKDIKRNVENIYYPASINKLKYPNITPAQSAALDKWDERCEENGNNVTTRSWSTYCVVEGYPVYTFYGSLFYGPRKINTYTFIMHQHLSVDENFLYRQELPSLAPLDTFRPKDGPGGRVSWMCVWDNVGRGNYSKLKWTYYDRDTYTWNEK